MKSVIKLKIEWKPELVKVLKFDQFKAMVDYSVKNTSISKPSESEVKKAFIELGGKFKNEK